MSVTNNIDIPTLVSDTHDIPQTLNEAALGWQDLKLILWQGQKFADRFYQKLISSCGDAVGVADGEPFWNGYLGQWQVAVDFASGCKPVVCVVQVVV